MKQQSGGYYQFDNFRVDALRRLLFKDGEHIKLTPKAFDLLLLFIESGGAILKKEQLIESLWPGIAVEENNLTQNISLVRKTLGDRLQEHKYIITIPGQGYRFVADVRDVAAESNDDAKEEVLTNPSLATKENSFEILRTGTGNNDRLRTGSRVVGVRFSQRHLALILLVLLTGTIFGAAILVKLYAPAPTPSSSIAVLPFKILNDQDCTNPFGAKMADAVITRLGGTSSFSVRPTNDVLKYSCTNQNLKDIGRALNVDLLLDGKIQQSDGNIRLTAQIIRVQDGKSVWVGKFDQSYTDCLAVQDALSMVLAQDLNKDFSVGSDPVEHRNLE